jgi:hypothetical protein
MALTIEHKWKREEEKLEATFIYFSPLLSLQSRSSKLAKNVGLLTVVVGFGTNKFSLFSSFNFN